jgi:hypothetical protein
MKRYYHSILTFTEQALQLGMQLNRITTIHLRQEAHRLNDPAARDPIILPLAAFRRRLYLLFPRDIFDPPRRPVYTGFEALESWLDGHSGHLSSEERSALSLQLDEERRKWDVLLELGPAGHDPEVEAQRYTQYLEPSLPPHPLTGQLTTWIQQLVEQIFDFLTFPEKYPKISGYPVYALQILRMLLEQFPEFRPHLALSREDIHRYQEEAEAWFARHKRRVPKELREDVLRNVREEFALWDQLDW